MVFEVLGRSSRSSPPRDWRFALASFAPHTKNYACSAVYSVLSDDQYISPYFHEAMICFDLAISF